MPLVLHLVLFVAIGLLRVASKIQVPLSFQDVKQVADEVQAKASPDEIETLRTLLLARREWHPSAPALLHNVLDRGGEHGRRLVSCSSYQDEATCIKNVDPSASCLPCKWNSWGSGGGMCGGYGCADYENQTACCANTNKVKAGCYWNQHGGGTWSQSTGGSCVELGDCSAMVGGLCNDSFGSKTDCSAAQPVCNAISGCEWASCGGCNTKGTTCTCDGTSKMCVAGGGSAAGLAAAMTGRTGCGLQDCVLCLKRDEGGNMDVTKITPCATIASRAKSSRCADQCSKIVQTDDEAMCLGKSQSLCPSPVAGCVADAITNSCATSASSQQSCDGMCTAFDNKCKSGGATSDCTVSYGGVDAGSPATQIWILFASALVALSLLISNGM